MVNAGTSDTALEELLDLTELMAGKIGEVGKVLLGSTELTDGKLEEVGEVDSRYTLTELMSQYALS